GGCGRSPGATAPRRRRAARRWRRCGGASAGASATAGSRACRSRSRGGRTAATCGRRRRCRSTRGGGRRAVGEAELLVAFRGVLGALDGSVHEASSLDDARRLARELIDGATVVRWDGEALDGIASAAAPAEAAEVSLIVADVGSGDTGQIGLVRRAGRLRGEGLL